MINFDVLLGVKPTDNLRWILPALYAVVGAIGLIWGIVLWASRPQTYESIGLGANAATGRTFADIAEPVGASTGGAA